MEKPLTKEQLIVQKAVLEAKVKELEEQDSTLRHHLSVALGAGTYKKNSYSESEQIVYSWYSIFREVGKLLAKRDYVEFRDNIQNTAQRLEDIQNQLWRLQNPEDSKGFRP